MTPAVDLAPSAERNPLALRLASLLRTNLRSGSVQATVRRMHGNVCVVASDLDVAVTARFDFGRVTLHDDVVGVPDVTIRGSSQLLGALREVPSAVAVARKAALAPRAFGASLGAGVRALRQGEFKVYGWVQHPRLVRSLLKVLLRQHK